jgi:aminoglycoside 6'-N-acetyltransferase
VRVILTGDRVVLRTGLPDDVDALASILAEPSVAERWDAFTRDEIEEQFVASETSFVVIVDDAVVGAIQFGEEEEPMYRHASVDIFLTTTRQDQGLGRDAIRTLARYLIDERGHHRLSIDPAADNLRAIRAYEAVGFRRVGVLRRYERGPDGTWHDGVLMDLLAEELS